MNSLELAIWRYAISPALVVLQQLAAPVAVVEGRVGQHVVVIEVRVLVVTEGVAVGLDE